MTTIQKQHQDFVQQLIRAALEMSAVIAESAGEAQRLSEEDCAFPATLESRAVELRKQMEKHRALLEPFREQQLEFKREERLDSGHYVLPFQWPAVPQDGVYARGFFHRFAGQDDYEIHDEASFQSRAPECGECKPIVILDADRYAQLTQPRYRVRIEHMKESHRETWWVVITDRDRPVGAKPWDGGRLEVYMSEKLPHVQATAEEWAEFFGTQVEADPVEVPPGASLYPLRFMRAEARDLINRLEAARPPNVLEKQLRLAGEAFTMLRLFLMNCEPNPPIGNE